MFTYCLNNPANGLDPCGTCYHADFFWNDCENCKKEKDVPFANYVKKANTTYPICDYDFGPFGRIRLYSSTTTQNVDEGVIYVYTDYGHEAGRLLSDRTTEIGTGVNIFDKLGFSLGSDSAFTVFLESQTSCFANRISVGVDGVGYSLSLNCENTSLVLDIEGGDGTWLLMLLVIIMKK